MDSGQRGVCVTNHPLSETFKESCGWISFSIDTFVLFFMLCDARQTSNTRTSLAPFSVWSCTFVWRTIFNNYRPTGYIKVILIVKIIWRPREIFVRDDN